MKLVVLLSLTLLLGNCQSNANFPTSKMSESKLSIHTGFFQGGPLSWQVVKQGRPRVIKLLDSFSQAQQIKQDIPGIVIVGRVYLANQPQTGDPRAAAESWFAANNDTMSSYPAVDYWEAYNEPGVSSADQLQWIAAMEAHRVQLMATAGLRASVFNLATGTPDVTDSSVIPLMYPAIDAALKHGGVLGLHEYSAAKMSAGYSGGTCDGSGWLTGRYRKLYRQYLIPANRTIPLVISENGIDCGTCPITHCNCKGGWKATGASAEQYMSQLQWYDSLLKCDPYVIGSTIFALEIPGDWQSFDIAPVAPLLIKYLQE